MKKNIFLALLVVFHFSFDFLAQCENDVNTNYNCVPSNSTLPSNPNSIQYLNHFDWQPKLPNLELEKYQTNGLNPGLLLPNGEINNIYSNQMSLGGYYDYLYLNPEMTPENGWELIGFNLGFYPNMNLHSSEFNDFPYIFLYNKLTGVFRIFGLLGPGYAIYGTSIDAVVIRMILTDEQPNPGSSSFNSYSGLLRMANHQDHALDKSISVSQVAALAKHPNANGRWFSADFQMAYDPCICNFEKRIKFEFDFIEQEDIKAQINAISVQEDLINGNIMNSDLDFMNAFSYHWLPPSDPSGQINSYTPTSSYVVYKSIETLIDKYIEQIEEYEAAMGQYSEDNKRLKRNKIILQAIKYSIVIGSATLIGWPAVMAGTLLESAPDVVKNYGPSSNGNDPVILGDEVVTLEYLTELGSEISTFIGEKFMNNDPPVEPVAPTPPMATFTQMNMSGAITKTTTIDGPNMYQPGSYKGEWFDPVNPVNILSMHEYPVYNELLGHFALLTTPTVNLNQVSFNHFYHPPNDWNIQSSPWWHFNYTNIPYFSPYPGEGSYGLHYLQQMQLDLNTLKYAINPALDMSDYKLEVSIGCRAVRNPNVYSHPVDGTPYTYTSPNYSANVESQFHDFMDSNPTNLAINQHVEGLTDVISIESPFIPLEDMTNVVSSLCTKHVRQAHLENYDQYLNNSDFYLNNKNLWGIGQTVGDNEFWDYFKITPDSMYIKIRLTMTHELPQIGSEPSCDPNITTGKEMVYLFSFPVNVNQTSTLPPDLEINNSPYNFSNYDDNHIFSNTHFDGSFVRGCYLDGSTYLCRGKQKITIEGEITIDPGYNVVFRAPIEVVSLPESMVPPEAIVEIGPFYDGLYPIPPQSTQQVSEFCSGTLYKANTLRSDIAAYYDSIAQSNPKPQPEPEPLEFSIFPNPTNGSAQALVSLPEMATVSITLIDLTGKVIGEPIQNTVMAAGRNFQNLQTEGLSPGVYFVHLVVNGEKYVERLVKR